MVLRSLHKHNYCRNAVLTVPYYTRIKQCGIHLNRRTTSIINKKHVLRQTTVDFLSKQIRTHKKVVFQIFTDTNIP